MNTVTALEGLRDTALAKAGFKTIYQYFYYIAAVIAYCHIFVGYHSTNLANSNLANSNLANTNLENVKKVNAKNIIYNQILIVCTAKMMQCLFYL